MVLWRSALHHAQLPTSVLCQFLQSLESNEEIFKKTIEGKFKFTSDFDFSSKLSKELISKLLEYDFGARLTSEQALNHAWFDDKNLNVELKSILTKSLMNNLKDYKVTVIAGLEQFAEGRSNRRHQSAHQFRGEDGVNSNV